MKHRYDVVISYDQALLDLDSFATLYLAFTKPIWMITSTRVNGRGGC